MRAILFVRAAILFLAIGAARHGLAADPAHPTCAGSVDASFLFSGSVRPTVVVAEGLETYVGTWEGGFRLGPDGTIRPGFRLDTRWDFDYAAPIFALAADNDDRWLVGGSYQFINGAPRSCIARVLPDGTVDPTFAPAPGAEGPSMAVYAIAFQEVAAGKGPSEQRILIGGSFNTYNGVARTNLARLNRDGSLDQTFDAGGGPRADVKALAVQPDGRVLVGGDFLEFDRAPAQYLCRLLPNGARDPSFAPPPALNGSVLGIRALADGKILIHGMFGYTPGINFVMRLNSDGSIDPAFQANVDGPVKSLAVQADGKILIGGFFRMVDGQHFHLLARLNTDGSLDPTFESGLQMLFGCGDEEAVFSVSLDVFERVIVGGTFFEVNGLTRRSVARLFNDDDNCPGLFYFDSPALQVAEAETTIPIRVNRSGSGTGAASVRLVTRLENNAGENDLTPIFTTLNFAAGEFAKTVDVPIHQDTLLEGGEIFSVALESPSSGAGLRHPEIARITILDDESAGLPGSVDLAFDASEANSGIIDLKRMANGKLMVTGYFTAIGGGEARWIARLNADGSLDPTFRYTGEFNYLSEIAIAGEKVYVAATRDATGTVIRLNADGSIDPAFSAPTLAADNPYAGVTALALQSDGKLLIGGGFAAVNGTPRGAVARLLSNGQLDESFDPGIGIQRPDGWSAMDFAIFADNSILVAGRFNQFNLQPRLGTAHLAANGALLDDFRLPARVTAATALDAAVQPDGKIVVAGRFQIEMGATPLEFLFRFNADGTVDSSFAPPSDFSQEIWAIDVQADGKILVPSVARLLPSGAIDPTWFFPQPLLYSINNILALPDGDVLIGGSFSEVNGAPRPSIARLNGGNYSGPGIITASSVDAWENAGVARINLAREWSAAGEIVVRYRTADRAALAGRDYTATEGTLTFGPGVATQEIVVPLIDDQRHDGALSFAIELELLTAGSAIRLTEDELTVSILDNDTLFTLAAPPEIPETHGTVTLYVLRSGIITAPASVRLTVAPGTATAGSEFTPISRQIDFEQGMNQVVVTFDVFDDSIPEATETIEVTLSDPSPGILLADNSSMTIRLLDNSSRFGFTAAEMRVHESAGAARVWVQPILSYLQPETAPPFRVAYRTAGGTAQAGVDYTPVTGELAFQPRQANPLAIEIPLSREFAASDPKTIEVELVSVTGEALLDPARMIVTVVDDGKVLPSGALDARFSPLVLSDYPTIQAMAYAPDYLYVSGYFPSEAGADYLRRYDHSGALDTTYRAAASSAPAVMLWVAGSKLLAGGSYQRIEDRDIPGLLRLNPNGSVDQTFSARFPGQFSVRDMTVDLQDRIVVAGNLSFLGGNESFAMRLLPNGEADGAFSPVTANQPENYSQFATVAIAQDGKILLGGSFDRINGLEKRNLVRLNIDGSIDETFALSGFAADTIYKVIPLPDGKALVHGYLRIDGQFAEVARVNPDGSLDRTFSSPAGLDSNIARIARDFFGRILLAGNFTRIGQREQRYLSRLLPDGELDDSFFPPLFDGVTYDVMDTARGAYVSGAFLFVNNQFRPWIARLHRDSPAAFAQPLLDGQNATLYFNFPANVPYVVESTENFASWAEVARGISATGNITLPVATAGEALFYRARERFN